MKRIEYLLKFSFAIACLLCGLIILDYLPLHDIYKDYVSFPILTHLNIIMPVDLPAWTRTELEWNIVTFNYLAKTAIAIFNISLIILLDHSFKKYRMLDQVR